MTRRINKVNKISDYTNQRKIIAIDLENAVSNSHVSVDSAASLKAKLDERYDIHPRDIVVVGVSHSSNALSAKMVWGNSAEIKMESGKNGGDQALQKSLDRHMINANTFSQAIIVSGDHFFVESTRCCIARRLPVTVSSPQGNMSHKLAAIANKVDII